MRRDLLLLAEMIDAAEQAQWLVQGLSVEQLEGDRQRREALLWNFTVLGEAATQLSAEVKERFPEVVWQQPMRLRNRIVHGYWSIDIGVLHTTASGQLAEFMGDLRRVLGAVRDEPVGADTPDQPGENNPLAGGSVEGSRPT